MQSPLFFDIETAPLPESELKDLMPEFEAPGNLKDPEKIKAAIEAKRQAWIDSAALDATTGYVLAIGVLIGDCFICIADPALEAQMLYEFWDSSRRIDDQTGYPIPLIGFNCKLFDLPFLIRRSWRLGVKVPKGIFKNRRWSDHIIDLRELWQLGDRQAHGSLDTISKHLGIGAKTGSGKDFATLWQSDRNKAIEYLKNDLVLTSKAAMKMGVI